MLNSAAASLAATHTLAYAVSPLHRMRAHQTRMYCTSICCCVAFLPAQHAGQWLMLVMVLHTVVTCTPPHLLQVQPDKEAIKTAQLAALLLPLRACQSQAKKGKTNPTVSLIVADSLKWKKLYAAHVTELHTQAPALLAAAQQLQVTVQSGCNC